MNYKQLTVFNFRFSYYLVRIFTLLWLFVQYRIFKKFSLRPQDFYESSYWIQDLFFPVFPSEFYFLLLEITCAILVILSIFYQKIYINCFIFVLLALINIPIVSYNGASHTNHVFVLSYFFSIFLLPKKLKEEDIKYIEYYYAGMLITYSFSGFWKIFSMIKNTITQSSNLLWCSENAAKINTISSYHYVDLIPPDFIINSYDNSTFWFYFTLFGIAFQFLCVLGAFNRNKLTLVMIFLITFHFYTQYFVLADLGIAKFGLIILFFPYHILWFFKTKNET